MQCFDNIRLNPNPHTLPSLAPSPATPQGALLDLAAAVEAPCGLATTQQPFVALVHAECVAALDKTKAQVLAQESGNVARGKVYQGKVYRKAGVIIEELPSDPRDTARRDRDQVSLLRCRRRQHHWCL